MEDKNYVGLLVWHNPQAAVAFTYSIGSEMTFYKAHQYRLLSCSWLYSSFLLASMTAAKA